MNIALLVIYLLYIIACFLTCARVYEEWPALAQGSGQRAGKIAQSYREILRFIRTPLLIVHVIGSLIYLISALIHIPSNKNEAMGLVFGVVTYGLSALLSLYFIKSALVNHELNLSESLQPKLREVIKKSVEVTGTLVENHLPLTLKIVFTTHLLDLIFKLVF